MNSVLLNLRKSLNNPSFLTSNSNHGLVSLKNHYCKSSSSATDTNHSYANTLNLPKTSFSMKANAVTREPTLLYDPYKLYLWQKDNNKGEDWILHDGPPYANGDLHMGHALNKILKDIVNRYKMLRGHRVNFIPGWDCHGLPIEQQAFKKIKKGNMSAVEIRKIATDFAMNEIAKQKKEFRKLGVMGDWEDPYMTLEPRYEVGQIQTFFDMYSKGYIYRGVKPVHWSPSSRTALADAELEYNEAHVSKSIFVKFKTTSLSQGLADALKGTSVSVENLNAIIWTTTPWTIPANLAISVSPTINYVVCKGNNNNEYYIVSQERLDSLRKSFSMPLEVVAEIQGKELAGTVTAHPQFNRRSPIILGDHVIEGSGTGLVHTAPGHGVEDFQVCKAHPDIPVISPVDDAGLFTIEAGEKFVGLDVLGDGNEAVITDLASIDALVFQEDYVHKYPYDWRTKKPIIIRTTNQWFVDLQNVQQPALESISRVNFVPPSGTNRLSSMVGKRNDWCISRQRVWGVPIPVFYRKDNDEPLVTDQTIQHVKEVFAQHGSDAWFSMDVKQLLPKEMESVADQYIKGNDTMDVWFDSGTSWRGVLVQRGIIPEDGAADLYLEGSDQHRGWFQSSLLTSQCVRDREPYKNVVTHGFLLDEKGIKMSKSIGNTIVPATVISGGSNKAQYPGYGVDLLRLWVASSEYSRDVSIGPTILTKILDSIKKLRNSQRFMLASNFDFNPALHTVPYEQLSDIDKYALHKLHLLQDSINKSYDAFSFQKVYNELINFSNEMSAFYFDIIKQRLYVENPNSLQRRSSQTVLFEILETVNKSLAPITIHTSEDVYRHQFHFNNPSDSIFMKGWFNIKQEHNNVSVYKKFNNIITVRDSINRILQSMRDKGIIGRSDEAKISISITNGPEPLYDILSSMSNQLNDIFCVSGVEVTLDSNNYKEPEQEEKDKFENSPITIENDQFELDQYLSLNLTKYMGKVKITGKRSDKHKCPRCWRHQSETVDHLCNSCDTIIQSLKN
ncbi:hypothetical protein CYY_007922 [Polysphondylium violaceum]|uniref:isoleucine--tRNA ligase n=1 Tax=Polysphondylium violaceum TaxID=133409 RepID=A0A8J4PR64_9MYCE|nr:hypothetical protein CYY_007922 [Polysphondylium violaceum]